MWLGLNHPTISEKAYKQTGPTLPLEPLVAGDVAPEHLGLYRDLLPFWNRIGGNAVYDEAVALVDGMWASGALNSWSDAHTIVEDHEPHPGIVEGLEGAEWEIEAADAEPAHDGGVPPDGDMVPAADDMVVPRMVEPEAMVDAEGDSKAVPLIWPNITCFPVHPLSPSPADVGIHAGAFLTLSRFYPGPRPPDVVALVR